MALLVEEPQLKGGDCLDSLSKTEASNFVLDEWPLVLRGKSCVLLVNVIM